MTVTRTKDDTPQDDLRYLRLLSREFPTIQSVYTEIINLESTLNLPKGTEHFVSDIHGEPEAFRHILNNCSGVIRERVDALYGDTLSDWERAELCTLIYYPTDKLYLLRHDGDLSASWYDQTLKHLVEFARTLSDGYTHARVREALPETYGYIIDELLYIRLGEESAHHSYHEHIIDSIIATGAADDFIRAITHLIKDLAVDHLHVVGDLYDRGRRGDLVADELMAVPSVDIQWGNHDAAWMGAAAGSEVCQAQVVRTCVRYGTLDILESAYGVSLRELALFADSTYGDEPGKTRMEKAIDCILFKLVEQAIARNPSWEMDDRCLLGHIDVNAGTVRIDGRDWPLVTRDFPTLDPDDPSRLTEGERRVMKGIAAAFANSDHLREHAAFLYEAGSVYLIRNGMLLFHGCVPLDADGKLFEVACGGERLSGRAYLDYVDRMARRAWQERDQEALDWMWYLWCGAHSPLSGRTMKTFERAYVSDKSTWKEPQDPYFDLASDPEVCRRVLADFGLMSERARIVNGHTPVHEISGETAIRANGQLLVIDGGFCRAYHSKTGIAGYTLISDADGIRLKAHHPFTSVAEALACNDDIASIHVNTVEDTSATPTRIIDTDRGKDIARRMEDLSQLLVAYRSGLLRERGSKRMRQARTQ